MSKTKDRIEELQKQLIELESENMRLYNQCKSVIGWPVCGERPAYNGSLTKLELDEDAMNTIEKWIAFVKTMNSTYKIVNKSVLKKFKLYRGEEKVPESKVKIGKPAEAAIKKDRILDL